MPTTYKHFLFGLSLGLLLMLPLFSYANENHARALLVASLLERIEALIEQLETLQATEEVTPDATDDEIERFDWAFVRASEASPAELFGDKEQALIFETDGAVEAVRLISDCDESTFLLIDKTTCQTTHDLDSYSEKDGTRTFVAPITVSSRQFEDEIEVRVLGCRFNGCVEEFELELPYKEVTEFTDLVSVTDRWEYEYEYDDEIFHVQEVMVAFPADEILSLKARFVCESNALYKATDDADRIACQGRRTFSRGYFDDVTTDDAGNEYNLLIQLFMSEVRPVDESGAELELTFQTFDNNVYTVTHTPELWEGDESDE